MNSESPPVACTYCSKDKRVDDGLLPAVERYLSNRITRLHAAGPMLILSGEYGLLDPSDPIPWYDHLLQPSETQAMATKVASQLREKGIQAIEFHTADPSTTAPVRPYAQVMRAACKAADVRLEIVLLASDEP